MVIFFSSSKFLWKVTKALGIKGKRWVFSVFLRSIFKNNVFHERLWDNMHSLPSISLFFSLQIVPLVNPDGCWDSILPLALCRDDGDSYYLHHLYVSLRLYPNLTSFPFFQFLSSTLLIICFKSSPWVSSLTFSIHSCFPYLPALLVALLYFKIFMKVSRNNSSFWINSFILRLVLLTISYFHSSTFFIFRTEWASSQTKLFKYPSGS